MRLLLDTHVLLWWLAADTTLSSAARDAIADEANIVAVSAATAWEIAIKRSLGKLEAPDDLEDQMRDNEFEALAISLADALTAGSLPQHHDDPFDRMLVAQARRGGFALVTRDSHFGAYGVVLISA